MRNQLFVDAKGQLAIAGVLPGGRYHKEGAMIIREHLKNGSTSDSKYFSLVGEVGGKLLDANANANAFALDINSSQVTFQSTLIKRYCEQNLAFWN